MVYHFIWPRAKNSRDNTINRLNIILCYTYSLNTYEYLICQINQ